MDGEAKRPTAFAAPGNALRSRLAAIAVATLGLGTVGCTTNGQPTTTLATPRTATVAFESIDGPPESIFKRLVHTLSAEADARHLAVVSREAPAQYRVRGYLATIVQKNRSMLAWVWDVYDADHRRALRISGEEPIMGAGRTTWAAASDDVLQRIARSGMDRLVAFLGAPVRHSPSVPPPAPEDHAVAVASVDPGP
jgi:hypothetical protein